MRKQQHGQESMTMTCSQDGSDDTVDRLLRQAEISRLTRNLKSKLALASLKTQQSPKATTPRSDQKRRAKTLESALISPRPTEGRHRSNSRRSSVTSISSASSFGSSPSVLSPNARIPRISSVNSIYEESFPDGSNHTSLVYDRSAQLNSDQVTPQTSPQQNALRGPARSPILKVEEEEPLPREPKTPPSNKRAFPKTPERNLTNDGANLLLHFAHSPGAVTPRTPDFNMNDYLHFQTPSPARGQMTPRHMKWGGLLSSALFQPAGPAAIHRPAGSGANQEGRS